MNKEFLFRSRCVPEQACCLGSRCSKYFVSFLLFTVGVLFATNSQAGTLLTDKPDYFPGEYVVFSGAGWQAGEQITIDIYETSADPLFWEGSVSTTVRADGTFSNSDFLIQSSFLGLGFMAHAIGSSGASASTRFTDAVSCAELPNGIAPVNPPAGGFGITGSLLANVPTSGVGDWVSNSISSGGGFVLYTNGLPVDTNTTFHFVDAFGSGSDDNFGISLIRIFNILVEGVNRRTV